MNRLKVLIAFLTLFFSFSVNAQIFVNTGNPDLDKYVKQDSNAVIWDRKGVVPVPPNIPAEPERAKVTQKPAEPEQAKVTPKPAAKTNNAPVSASTHAVKQPSTDKKESAAVVKKTPEKAKKEPVAVVNKEKPNYPNRPVKPKTEEPASVKVRKPVTPKTEEPMAYSAYKKQPVPDYPPDAVIGRCYARCQAPDQIEYKEELVLDKPASVKVEHIPPVYETVNETVVIVPAGKKIITIPAQYEMVTENKMVSPASQKWVRVASSKNCFSPNPKDCEIWSLKDFPAVYEKVSHKVEVAPAQVKEEEIPAVTQVMARKKMVKPAEEVKTEMPASYKTVMKRVLLKKGGMYEWKEILCEQDVTEGKINQIQQALQREGYDPGVIDNQMGEKTKESIIRFQQDKGLPVGNLNMETLKALGVQ